MTVVLINSFTVPAGREEEFLDAWNGTVAHFVTAPGFLGARLHRNLGHGDRTFQFVNVARWSDVGSYRAALKDFVPAGQRIEGVTAHPGLFEVCAELTPTPRSSGAGGR
ncbi:hypothetical protein Val02_89770 [Virgisporangium aliadipatigenens]|uniref:ABM domain-containing protein n=1 Tax=Virgisporangium aliadipatigenens TaxID=741659 RepID=A0A8J4DW36_9ACTN|nr:antibiotic biosynthesis monooxygenase family protein [Virgisporangium aliadipatigenens]GIJ52091.1 hypothetical protein Val02_89770 [Virgisporangium aliadipatigenens]